MRYFSLLSIFLLALLLQSCSRENTAAIIWTDRAEFAMYAEYFNSLQGKYKIETRYYPYPARVLTGTPVQKMPDIVVGSWLKSAATRSHFAPLDGLFKGKKLKRDTFYPSLLALGSIDKKQYLLPVSFNLPSLIFSRSNGSRVTNPFVITLDEIKELGGEYNKQNNSTYTHMGFSPAWNEDFLYVVTSLFNTNFREANPLAWDPLALEKSITYIQNWIKEKNTSVQAEEDFVFKYLFSSPSKLAASGRILFGYMQSYDLFTLPEEQQTNLDFRWVAHEKNIIVLEGSTYIGICKEGKARKAANAFLLWFFNEETQLLLLENSRKFRINEGSFGIANGFSALRTVTEQIYPRFYPLLLGHMPPQDYLCPPNILPSNWMVLKERVILPYFHERLRTTSRMDLVSLERRISEWYRQNPNR